MFRGETKILNSCIILFEQAPGYAIVDAAFRLGVTGVAKLQGNN